jgi:hypothetical protein
LYFLGTETQSFGGVVSLSLIGWAVAVAPSAALR